MKSKEFKFRLSQDLYSVLEEKAAHNGNNISDYIRQLIKNDNNVKNSMDNGKLLGQINKIGNNINQIAHVLNTANMQNKLEHIDYNNLLDKLILIEYRIKEFAK